jgi:uncharacterized OB-fold protein
MNGTMTGVIVLRCAECHAAARSPRVRCSECGSTRLSRETIRGDGTVFSSTTDGVRGIALVDLAEGLRLLAVDPSGALDLPIGAAVSVAEVDCQLIVTRGLDD